MTHPLLTPRYKVSAPIPGRGFAHFLTGDILVQKSHPLYPDSEIYGREDEDDVCKWTTVCKDYPHLFTLMHWAEDRAADEMPEYVKDKQGIVVKVGKWNKSEFNLFASIIESDKYNTFMVWWGYPATLSEYEAYKNQSI